MHSAQSPGKQALALQAGRRIHSYSPGLSIHGEKVVEITPQAVDKRALGGIMMSTQNRIGQTAAPHNAIVAGSFAPGRDGTVERLSVAVFPSRPLARLVSHYRGFLRPPGAAKPVPPRGCQMPA